MKVKQILPSKKKKKLFSIEITPELPNQKSPTCFDGSPDQLINIVNPFSHPHPLRQLGGLQECIVLG